MSHMSPVTDHPKYICTEDSLAKKEKHSHKKVSVISYSTGLTGHWNSFISKRRNLYKYQKIIQKLFYGCWYHIMVYWKFNPTCLQMFICSYTDENPCYVPDFGTWDKDFPQTLDVHIYFERAVVADSIGPLIENTWFHRGVNEWHTS